MVRAVLVLTAVMLASCTYKDANYENGEDFCADQKDNDGDGATDCDDSSCDDWCGGDTDTDTDTDVDTDTDTDTDVDTDTDTDVDTDVDTDTDTDTDTSCVSDTECDSDEWCDTDTDTDGVCVDCGTDDDLHCGPACLDCVESSQHCNVNICVDCVDTSHCDTAEPQCDTDNDGGVCVECLEDDHCRDTDSDAAPHLSSPLGVCTPDHTCTCWVEGDTDECFNTSTDCPTGFHCAADFGVTHYACLRSCSPAVEPASGLVCEERLTVETSNELVWVPMTTCYAFFHFGEVCTAGECSVDGTGGINDGFCPDGVCTYNCDDGFENQDSWCPEVSGSCGSSAPYNGLCEP